MPQKIFNRFLLILCAVLVPYPAYALIAGGCGTVCINYAGANVVGAYSPDLIAQFLWRQLLIVIAFYGAGYILGRFVQQKKCAPSLSRKMICLLTFAVSFANALSVSSNGMSPVLLVLFGCVVLLLMLGSLAAPIRTRVPMLNTVFASINRPEDEPYTLRWLSTEAVATSAIIMIFFPIISYFTRNFVVDYGVLYSVMLIPVFASGIGDALAEIVGKKWGRHHYTTHAIFGNRTYTRSLEGSAMVFLTTLIVGIIIAAQFSFQMPIFYWKAFILLPITLTLAEAKAPHTWDNPLLYLVGYITIILCLV